jgi:hypothetical protein
MEDVLRLFDERRRDVVVEQLLDLWMVVKVGVILLDDGGLARLRTCARARDTVSAIARRQHLYSSSAQGRGAVATNLPLRHQIHDGMEAEELLHNALARHGVFARGAGYTYLS